MRTDILAEKDHIWEPGHLMIDIFIDHATVRNCVDCGVLIAGGPNRCNTCARALSHPEHKLDLKAYLKAELLRLIDEESEKIHPLFCETFGTSALSKKTEKLMIMRRMGKRDAYMRVLRLLDNDI